MSQVVENTEIAPKSDTPQTKVTKSAKTPSMHLVSPIRNVFKKVAQRYNDSVEEGEGRKFNMTKEGATVISEILYRILVDVISPQLSPQPQLQKGKNNCPKSITAPVCREAFLGFVQVGHTRRMELGIEDVTFNSICENTTQFNQFVDACLARVEKWNAEHKMNKANAQNPEESTKTVGDETQKTSRSNSDKAGVSLPHAKITSWIAAQHPKRNIMSDAKYQIVAGMEYLAVKLITECIRSATEDDKIRIDMNTVMRAKAQLERADDLFAGIFGEISLPTFDLRCKMKRVSVNKTTSAKTHEGEWDGNVCVQEVVTPKTPPKVKKAASQHVVAPNAPSKNTKKRVRPDDDSHPEDVDSRPSKVKATTVVRT